MEKSKKAKTIVIKKDGTIKARIPVPPTKIIENKKKKKEKHKKNLLDE